jgi:hypothetical protein
MGNSNTNQEAIAHAIEEFIKSGSCVLNSKGQILNLPHHFSYEAHRYLIQDGRLNPDHLLNAAFAIDIKQDNSVNNIDHKEKLIELAINNKANLNNLHSLSSLPSIEHLGHLLSMGLHPSNALKLIININTNVYNYDPSKNAADEGLKELKHNLINFLLERGGNFNSVESIHNYDSEDLEFLIERGFDTRKIV